VKESSEKEQAEEEQEEPNKQVEPPSEKGEGAEASPATKEVKDQTESHPEFNPCEHSWLSVKNLKEITGLKERYLREAIVSLSAAKYPILKNLAMTKPAQLSESRPTGGEGDK